MAAVMEREQTELSCVLIPLNAGNLLLPNVCMAEILLWRRIKILKDAPDWCLGLLGWRGQAIPVVRFELLNKPGAEGGKTGRCIIVMNRASSNDGFAFYALAAEGLPRMVQLTNDDLSNEPGKRGPGEVMAVKLGTESAIIPNLDFIESNVRKLKF
ncbi:MAG: chemotaxis protein CheW [Gammaproteobacteria bacterium]|nr:chemotaxis protein CheW [Gammaproteobacteria bacterium]